MQDLRSQNLDRIRPSIGRVPCITPGAKIWLRRRRRFLLGQEMFGLQGLDPGKYRAILASTAERTQKSLSGNALSFHCYAIGMIAALVSLPIAWLE